MQISIQQQLHDLRQRGLYRSTRLVSGSQGAHVQLGGRDVLLLCSNNYLGLADHPALIDASLDAIRRYGVSSSASRLVSGTMELHESLEAMVCSFKGSEAALLFNSGYAANTGIIPALVGRGDVVFSDRLNHASIIDGIMLSGARLVRYPHNDLTALERLLQQKRGDGRCLIISDGVFSMDGDLAHLPGLVQLRDRYDALLMIDDAHGCGVLGDAGRGSAELMGVSANIDIQVGTFGKALGSFGAYAALSAELRELLVNRARSFIFSTSLPPGVLAASSAALELVMSAEGAHLRQRLQDNTTLFRGLLQQSGFDTAPSVTQIVPLLVGTADVTMRFSEMLLDVGIYVQGIRPPTVPNGSCRLRCTVMATHTVADLTDAAARIAECGRQLGVV